MPTAPSRAVAIINPSTRGNVARIEELLRIAAPATTQLDIYPTGYAGHAGELAREHAASADLLIAVGGDGTVAEVAGAAREAKIPVGIIPGGSTNITARELGIPTNAYLAARLLFENHAIRTIDAGVCGDRIFLHMAGAGVDSLLFDLASPALKRKLGWIAYLPAAIEALHRPLSRFTIRSAEMRIDSVRSPLVLVANGPSIIAPMLQLDTRIRSDDGNLDVFVVKAIRPDELARVLARMALRQLSGSPFVTAFTTKDVEISAEPAIATQLDGDVFGATPVRFTIDPGSVRIVVPRSR
ncbi:MAG: diacylglycerol kinase family lipid kinase [Chloroflexota bacterium]|nr:diacylglycerol kinase family lipid kinase [Chloroflexota bacterium]